MGQATRELAPGGNAFGNHQTLLLLGELARHFVERSGELADFVARSDVDARFPMTGGNLASARGQRLHRPRDSPRHPPGQADCQENPDTAHHQSNVADKARQQDEVAARAAHEQDAEQFIVAAEQRDGVKSLRTGSVGSELHRLGQRARVLADLCEEWSQAVGLHRRERAGGIAERAGDEALLEVSVEQRACALGQDERAQKVFIESQPTDEKEMFFSDADRAHGRERQGHAVGQLFAAEERAGAFPIRLPADPLVGIAEARGPLRGADQLAVVRHNFEEVKMVRGGESTRVVDVERSVGLRAGQFDGHAHVGFGFDDALHPANYFFAARSKLAAELRNQRFGALVIERLKFAAGVARHRP